MATLVSRIGDLASAVAGWIDSLRLATIVCVIDGGGAEITAGVKADLQIDFACQPVSWSLLGDQSGSIAVDVWRDAYAAYPPVLADSMVASAQPTLSSAAKATGSATTWDAIDAGDVLRFSVDVGPDGVERVTLSIKVRKLR